MTEPSFEAPNLVSVGAQSLVENAQRLGLTWTLRLATVDAGFNPNLADVVLDGDTEVVSAVSMIGWLTGGRRVYVLTVPPAGNFVVGGVSRFTSGERIATSVRTSGVTFTTVETVTDSVTADLVEGFTYRVAWMGLVGSTTANDSENVRIREDSLTGTQLQAARVFVPLTGTVFAVYLEGEYLAAATGFKTFVVTGQRVTGGGTVNHGAAATQPVYFYVDFIQDF